MELVKLGKKGQITIPKALLRSIGLVDDAPLIVEATSDGAIILRPAAVSPKRLNQFTKDYGMTPKRTLVRTSVRKAALYWDPRAAIFGFETPTARAQDYERGARPGL